MRSLKSLIYKDFLLLIRDKAGLAMLFLMPVILVAIMTYLQDSTFRSVNETKIPLLLLNQDKDSLGATIEKQIKASGIFQVSKTIGAKNLTKSDLVREVANGNCMIGIIIPENATENIRKNVKRYVFGAFNGKVISNATDSVEMEIYIDPITKNSFRATLMSTLREYAARTESDFIFNEITSEVNKLSPVPIADIHLARNQVKFKEQYARLDGSTIMPNSVQHNVPAWSMFAIFFIVISLAGNIIKERDDGSFNRLLTMPCPYYLYILSKIAVYLIVCLLQLIAVVLMGMYVIPLLGLPSLTLNNHYFALLLMGVCSALAAIGYGIAIGKIATTHQQASIFGAISVVIMAAVGGVWIPVFIMPQPMQLLSRISPLNWGLEGFYTIFVRDGNWTSVLPECAVSVLFSILCIAIAVFYHHKNREGKR